MARLRDVFGEIEETIRAGVSVAKVHETLLDQGFTMKFSAFQSSLYRLRKEKETGKVRAPNATPPASFATDPNPIPVPQGPSSTTEDGQTSPVWVDEKKQREADADRHLNPPSRPSIFSKKD
jgi:hypothetical protein